MDSNVPHLNFQLSPDEVKSPGEKVREILEVLRPNWSLEEVEICELSTGFINTNFGLTVDGTKKNGLFIRIMHDTMAGQKELAWNAMGYLGKHNLGAQLLLTYENGLVLELLEGKAVTWATTELVKEPKTWLAIARETAKYHAATDWDDVKHFNLRDTLDKINAYNKLCSDLQKAGRIPESMTSEVPSSEETMKIWLNLIEHVKKAGGEVKFCHNDINPTNIIIQEDGVAFVDYDICQTELTVYDIARLFVSIGGAVNFDYAKLPTDEEKDIFIREYLRSLHEFEPERGPVMERTVHFFKFLMRKGMLLAWIWAMETAMIIAGVSDRPLDLSIARIAWQEYQKTSPAVLSETFDWDS